MIVKIALGAAGTMVAAAEELLLLPEDVVVVGAAGGGAAVVGVGDNALSWVSQMFAGRTRAIWSRMPSQATR